MKYIGADLGNGSGHGDLGDGLANGVDYATKSLGCDFHNRLILVGSGNIDFGSGAGSKTCDNVGISVVGQFELQGCGEVINTASQAIGCIAGVIVTVQASAGRFGIRGVGGKVATIGRGRIGLVACAHQYSQCKHCKDQRYSLPEKTSIFLYLYEEKSTINYNRQTIGLQDKNTWFYVIKNNHILRIFLYQGLWLSPEYACRDRRKTASIYCQWSGFLFCCSVQ
jgi:hypothetical protein